MTVSRNPWSAIGAPLWDVQKPQEGSTDGVLHEVSSPTPSLHLECPAHGSYKALLRH